MPTPNGNVAGPLLGLVTPIIVEWKRAGQPDFQYVEAGRVGEAAERLAGGPAVRL